MWKWEKKGRAVYLRAKVIDPLRARRLGRPRFGDLFRLLQHHAKRIAHNVDQAVEPVFDGALAHERSLELDVLAAVLANHADRLLGRVALRVLRAHEAKIGGSMAPTGERTTFAQGKNEIKNI